MDWPTVKTVIVAAKDFLELVGLVVAGIWACYKFREANELSRQVNMEVATQEHPIDDKSSVLVIRIVLNNIGYRSLTPGKRGLEVSVKRLTAPGKDRSFQWSRGELVFDEVDILAEYKEAGATDFEGAYRLDRGGTYHETCALTIDRGYVYLIQAALWIEDDDLQIEYCYHVSADSSEAVRMLAISPRNGT